QVKAAVDKLEATSEAIFNELQNFHQNTTADYVTEICNHARKLFSKVKEDITGLQKTFPLSDYYRYADHWHHIMQNLVFQCSLIIYMEEDTLVTRDQVAQLLGVSTDKADGFHITLEDYLQGVLLLPAELTRIAVNCVIHEDYQRPIKIASFLSQLNAAYKMLNLKNDALRRKYDGLKYEVKKAEGIVYDMKIRRLIPSS
ncbi:uncharacterized protein TRIADDRAFT_20923, partial [Trichoplax adhaerens]